LDGYKATSTIRSEQPFVNNPEFQVMPIVAMTASAIQGDREKCQLAGMDDYLAKPVKRPNLERMLVKWAIEGKRKKAELAKSPLLPPRPAPNRATSSFSESSSQSTHEHVSSQLDRLEFAQRSAIERSTKDVGDVELARQQQEEKAITLRDDALMESGEDPKTKTGRVVGGGEDGHTTRGEKDGTSDESDHALTTENIEKLGINDRISKLKKVSTDDSSMIGETGSASMVDTLALSTAPGKRISRSSPAASNTTSAAQQQQPGKR
jgi:CheY-like chemotaxis protein